ncbi:hypothetical protein Tco_1402965 [Tanacetum coccineum]
MADSWKSLDLNKFVHDAIADDILDDLSKKEWEKQQRVKDDKRKVIEMKIMDVLEQRIEKVGKHLNKAKEKIDVNKGKEKMVMETATFDESSDHNPFQAMSDESSDHNPFQATSDESSDHNPFQVSTDDTLKSSSEDTCSSDSTWEQKKASKRKPGSRSTQAQKKSFDGKQGSSSAKAKKLLFYQRFYSGMMI